MAITVGIFFHTVFLLLFVVGSHATGQEVTGVTILHIGTNTATVTWTAPKQPHGDIMSYHVTVTNTDTKEQQELETTSNRITLRNLTPHTRFNIIVRAANKPFNVNGDGLGEPFLIILSTEPLAGQQVTDIKLPHIGTATVTVTWAAPKQPYGDIKSYYVTIMNRDTKEQQDIETPSNGITFHNLTPHTWYDITVRTENWQLNGNGGGLGEPVLIELLTEPLAGQKVRDITFPDIGSNSIDVQWRAPEMPFGEITSYRVETTDEKGNMIAETKVYETEATISNLSPFTTYNISVRTINKPGSDSNFYGGAGEAVTNVVTTQPLGKDDYDWRAWDVF